MQSMLAAIYPLLQVEFDLSYAQIGVMTLASRSPRRCCSR